MELKEIVLVCNCSGLFDSKKIQRNQIIYNEFLKRLLDNLSFITKLFNNSLFQKKLLWFDEESQLRFSSNFINLLKKSGITKNYNIILRQKIILKTYEEGISTQDWIKKIKKSAQKCIDQIEATRIGGNNFKKRKKKSKKITAPIITIY